MERNQRVVIPSEGLLWRDKIYLRDEKNCAYKFWIFRMGEAA